MKSKTTKTSRNKGKHGAVGSAGKLLTPSSKPGRLTLSGKNAAATVRKLEQGYSPTTLHDLKNALRLSWSELAELLQVRPRTLNRRRLQRRLPTDESERVLRISRVYNLAVELFEGDDEAARHWLKRPRKSLANGSPLWFARTEPGAREVEDLIGRLEHGVFT